MPYLSFGTSLKVGQEVSWGTAVARTVSFPLLSESLKRTVSRRPRGTLTEGSTRNRRKNYLESDNVGGSVEVLVTYEGFGILLYNLLGSKSTSGTGPYTHDFTLAKALPSLTAEPIRGDGTTEVYAGCKVAKGVLKVEAGKLLRATFELIGKDTAGPVAAGTASHTTSRDLVVSFAEAGDVDWNGDAFTAVSMEISVDNKLARRPLCGSTKTAEPMPNDWMDILFKLEIEWSGDEIDTAYQAGDESDLTVVFTGVDDAAGMSLEVLVRNAYVEDASKPISGAPGVVRQSVTFRGQDSSNAGIRVRLINTQSDAVAA